MFCRPCFEDADCPEYRLCIFELRSLFACSCLDVCGRRVRSICFVFASQEPSLGTEFNDSDKIMRNSLDCSHILRTEIQRNLGLQPGLHPSIPPLNRFLQVRPLRSIATFGFHVNECAERINYQPICMFPARVMTFSIFPLITSTNNTKRAPRKAVECQM